MIFVAYGPKTGIGKVQTEITPSRARNPSWVANGTQESSVSDAIILRPRRSNSAFGTLFSHRASRILYFWDARLHQSEARMSVPSAPCVPDAWDASIT